MSISERPQDPSSALDQATQDVANLKSEFHHILEEIKNSDMMMIDYKKRYLSRDSQLQKFIKQHGALTENPKEAELEVKMEEEMDKCTELQHQKCILANTALYLVTKHLSKIKGNIEALEEEGLLAPLDDEYSDKKAEPSGARSLANGTSGAVNGTASRKRPASSSSSNGTGQKRKQQKKEKNRAHQHDSATASRGNTPNGVTESHLDNLDYNQDMFKVNKNKVEEDDKKLYCFCQSVSYGEMVACDGPNCKYEWFHYSCVNLTEPPKGPWYCPDCRQEMAAQKLKKKKKQLSNRMLD